jgi:diguanylate cyclase (GGDEF)-like protein
MLDDAVAVGGGEGPADAGIADASRQRWDRVAWLAAQLLEAPLCLVALGWGERSVIQSAWPLEQPEGACAGAGVALRSILGARSPLAIEDVHHHSDADHLAALRQVGGTSCVVVPVSTGDEFEGARLCVIDSKPRCWSLRDAVILAELGRQAVAEIRLLRRNPGLADQAPLRRHLEVESVAIGTQYEDAPGHDPLTGLPNRLLLYDRLRQMLALARRYGEVLAILHVDLDEFKALNENHGDRVGDLVLQHVAASLAAGIRESDTLARLGSDDFMLVLPRVGSLDNAVAVASKILGVLDAPLDIQGLRISLRASVGISVFPEDGTDAAALLHLAGTALSKARAVGERVFAFQHERSLPSPSTPH